MRISDWSSDVCSSDLDRDYDSNYQAWRNNQMAELDRDYHEYRQENQQKFENEFGTWRQRRCSQRDCLGLVTEHMDVIGSDGEHVGKVDKVAGDRDRKSTRLNSSH